MKSLKEKLSRMMASAFESVGADPTKALVVDSQRPELSQFQCNGAMASAKAMKKNPREIAAAIVEKLKDEPIFDKVTVEGPGFINLSLTDLALEAEAVEAVGSDRLGVPKVKAQKIVMDFGGPNVAKSMHVGHLRSSIIGDCLQRLFRFLGHEVTSDVHLGDWGTQMGMLIEAVKETQPDLPYFDEKITEGYPAESPVTIQDLEELYPRASAACKEDSGKADAARKATQLQSGRPGYRALWTHFVTESRKALERDFGTLGVKFDLWWGESRYQEKIPAMLEAARQKGLLVDSEGAQVIMLDAEKGKEIPPILLVKSDGGYLYGTTDMATLEERLGDMGAQRVIYVTDKRQGLHFRQVFQAVGKMGWLENAEVFHAAFGTMNGKDGKPFKTRAGGVLKLKELLDMAKAEAHKKMDEAKVGEGFEEAEKEDIASKVALAAIKFADLSNHRSTDYIFDLEKFTAFEGKTGPYLLYQAVRIKSILRKAAEAGLKPGPLKGCGENERDILLDILRLPEILNATAGDCGPNQLCDYAYNMAQDFSSFYQKCHILKEEDKDKQAMWLGLCDATLRTLVLVLGILGMETPERM